jgi:hypothetical protein
MGAVLGETSDGIVASVVWLVSGRSASKRSRDIPAFPPVTIYTFPERSGRESGWNFFILGIRKGNNTTSSK